MKKDRRHQGGRGDTEKQENRQDVSRRRMLRGIGLGVAAGAAATGAMTGGATTSAASTTANRPAADYQETEHVRRAYALSRF